MRKLEGEDVASEWRKRGKGLLACVWRGCVDNLFRCYMVRSYWLVTKCHGEVAEGRFEFGPFVISDLQKVCFHYTGKDHQFYLES